MPAIGNIVLNKDFETTPGTVTVLPVEAKDASNASWANNGFPELGRPKLVYVGRKADPGTGLVKHSFRVTFPTLKSTVTDPSGPYVPPPAIDYVSVGEFSVWVHPRSTEAERWAPAAAILNATTSFKDAVKYITSGYPMY